MQSSNSQPAAMAREMLNRARKGALATLRAADSHPYVSMVQVAVSSQGQPVFLLSRLAMHTKNLLASPAASLLIDETSPDGDPAAGARVTFTGHVHAAADNGARNSFLARHPSAQSYASFADFDVYAMDIEGAHLIQGFGRIVPMSADQLFRKDERDVDA